jgi:fucose permease
MTHRSALPFATACTGTFTVGFIFALQGALLPYVIQDLHLSFTQGGIIGLCGGGMYIFMSLYSGHFTDKRGSRQGLAIGASCLGGGALLFSLSHIVGLLYLFRAFIGCGNAFSEISVNKMIAERFAAMRIRFMNLLHLFWGMGALLSPLFAGWLLGLGCSWRVVLAVAALPALVTLVCNFMQKPDQSAATTSNFSLRDYMRLFRSPRIALLFGLILCNVAAQQGIILWLVNYLQVYHNLSAWTSAGALSAFFAGLTAGRFIGFLLRDRLHPGILLTVTGSCMAASIAGGMFWSAPVILLFFITGLSTAPAVPVLAALAAEHSDEKAGLVMGGFFFAQSIGSTGAMFGVGVLNDLQGVQAGFAGVLCMAVLYTLLTLKLWNFSKSSPEPVA